MKKLLFALLFTSVLVSCKNDDNGHILEKGQVSFSLLSKEINKPSANKRSFKKQNAIPRKVAITLNNESGDVVYNNEIITLLNLNGSYITESMSLDVGNYIITSYSVLDEDNNIIYATPNEGSDLASFVNDPLPINFKVSKDGTITVIPEVISSSGLTAYDFGYASFSFTVVDVMEFNIIAQEFNTQTNTWGLTDATLEISTSGTEILTQELNVSGTKVLGIPSTYATYTVKVIKDGYADFEKTFTKEEMKVYGEIPLVVSFYEDEELSQGSFVVDHSQISDNENFVTFSLVSESEIIIDWGDGTIENLPAGDYYSNYSSIIRHNYTDKKVYEINLKAKGITKLDISKFYNEENFYFGYFIEANLEEFTELTVLKMPDNSVDAIDVSSMLSLEYLDLSNGNFTSIDVSKNIELKYLNLTYSYFNEIDITNNLKLETLLIEDSDLEYIDITNNNKLIHLDLNGNLLSSIDLRNNVDLEILYIEDNLITSLDLQNNKRLRILGVSGNDFSSIDISENKELENFYLTYSPRITNIDLSQNTKINQLWLYDNAIENIDLSNNILLREFKIENNLLSSIDLRNNTEIISLDIENNKINTLDLSKNIAINTLNASKNEISDIDLTANKNLNEIYLNDNFLDEIKFSSPNLIYRLDASNCNLSSLDISNAITNFKMLKITNNPNLHCVRKGVNQTIDEVIKDSHQSVSVSCD